MARIIETPYQYICSKVWLCFWRCYVAQLFSVLWSVFNSLVLFTIMSIIVLKLRLMQLKNISFLWRRLFVFAYLFSRSKMFPRFFFSQAIEVCCHESDLKKVQLRIWIPKNEIKNRYEKHSVLILRQLGLLGIIYINTVPKGNIKLQFFARHFTSVPFHIAPSHTYFSLQTNLKLLFSIFWRYFSFEISIPLLYLC